MVVDQPGRLHERVHRGRADEAEAAPLQVLAQRLRHRRSSPAARRASRRSADDRARRRRTPTRYSSKLPSSRLHARAPPARSSTVDSIFAAVAHDRRVGEQPLDVVGREARRPSPGRSRRRRRGSPRACAGSCVQLRPGLRALEREQLEQRDVVVLRHAPLVVVVGDHERVGPRPGAPRRFVPPVLGSLHDSTGLLSPPRPPTAGRAVSVRRARRAARPHPGGTRYRETAVGDTPSDRVRRTRAEPHAPRPA